MKDLLILTADKDAEFFIKSLLEKIPNIESTHLIDYDIISHPQRDPGVVTHAVEFVRPYINDYNFLMIIFDYEGSGKESLSKDVLESEMEDDLNKNGWQDRNVCIALYPELESWLWVNQTHLHNILDWEDTQNIYDWLCANGQTFNANKPDRPKEAFEAALRKQKRPRSSSIYSDLAQRASYRHCIDPSFNKFLTTIKMWFAH
ncbi:MAG: hypothetical protein BWY69_01518 [Planctomycetes bacterium ADurb.Bin401]|nr:MAG: hypothetical protein BWY69_01518 [Planctomycetes bacterium ADurb.Bin401]HNY51343.1 hypothetical protein [Smithella sp.]HQO14455.1 hypothetical protein [Smithellaceae bacterium]HOG90706.1 hypothetical protein [Smithella sp.]HOU51212.1 hypothetical protein [Smithella sp.]